MTRVRKDQLEMRIVLSRMKDSIDEELACRERAAGLGIKLDDHAIEREVAWWIAHDMKGN